MKRFMLAMTARLHDEIRRHLFPGDGREAAAIILCSQGRGRQHYRLIANEIIGLPHKKSKRKKDFLVWPFAAHLPPEKITDIDKRGLSIFTIHSHPGGYDKFSITDDKNDKELFPSICNWFDNDRPNGAAIMLPDGKIKARIVDAKAKFQDIPTVSVIGDNIDIWKKSRAVGKTAYHGKLAQTFGGGTLKLLQSLRVGVVGCSGTGSVLIELLARNCIGEMVIVDNDDMEVKNLNRIVNGKIADAIAKRSKVSVLKKAVKDMGMKTKVDAFQELTDSHGVIAALVDCDVIFGCVDSAFGRYHLECLTSAYCIPYFDVGVNLEADGKGGITASDAVAHYIHPEGEGLLARGAYTMEQVTAENYKRNDPAYYKKQRIAGYLAAVGEEQPAVISINMQAACLAFNDFLARIHSYRMDENKEFAVQRFRFVHGHYENSSANKGAHPLFKKYMGMGDKSVLVKNNLKK